jgi:hypothetical protein
VTSSLYLLSTTADPDGHLKRTDNFLFFGFQAAAQILQQIEKRLSYMFAFFEIHLWSLSTLNLIKILYQEY